MILSHIWNELYIFQMYFQVPCDVSIFISGSLGGTEVQKVPYKVIVRLILWNLPWLGSGITSF